MRLRKSGAGYSGLCPFHNEKSSSFHVSDEKSVYHCFGCGAKGNVIGFVMAYERISYPEAVEKLAADAGIPMERDNSTSSVQYQQHQHQEALLLHALEEACGCFERALYSPSGAIVRDYLLKRGLDEALIKSARLGFAMSAPGALIKALIEKGHAADIIVAAGLAVAPDSATHTESRLIERFRGRVIFPIHNHKGRICGFGGRILGDGQPKYLNSPETLVFHKGDILYGLFHARKSIGDSRRVIVVEGYMDVLSLRQHGVMNAVAPLGTALSAEQLEKLWRSAPSITMCMDGDAAGGKAMRRAAEMAISLLKPGLEINFLPLPSGDDPDTFIRKSGADKFNIMADQPLDLAEFVWRLHEREAAAASPTHRATAEKELLDFAEKATDALFKKHLRNYFKERIWKAGKVNISDKYKNNKDKKEVPSQAAELKGIINVDKFTLMENVFLRLVHLFPDLLQEPEVETRLEKMEFKNPPLEQLRQEILEAFYNGQASESVIPVDKMAESITANINEITQAQELFIKLYDEYTNELEKEHKAALLTPSGDISEDDWNRFLESQKIKNPV